jgi:hypothetical protein
MRKFVEWAALLAEACGKQVLIKVLSAIFQSKFKLLCKEIKIFFLI